MTHLELLSMLKKQLPRLNRAEGQILKEIIAGLGDKGDSLYLFYKELSTNGNILGLPNIKKVAENYTVPLLYKDLIDSRFDKFKKNLKVICLKNHDRETKGEKPGLDVNRWTIGGVEMFQTTEKKTIKHVGGINNICEGINTVGYFDYLKKTFLESATETSRLKYSLLLKADMDMIEYKDE